MAENVKPEVIKKTQDILGPFFSKPPLTSKLLKKPPFRFLRDIIASVIKETGYLKGLYTDEELNSDITKDRNAKIHFLNKLIYVVEYVSQKKLAIKASKIIAGLEPTKTNELLQLLGTAIKDKVNSNEAVKKCLKTFENKGDISSSKPKSKQQVVNKSQKSENSTQNHDVSAKAVHSQKSDRSNKLPDSEQEKEKESQLQSTATDNHDNNESSKTEFSQEGANDLLNEKPKSKSSELELMESTKSELITSDIQSDDQKNSDEVLKKKNNSSAQLHKDKDANHSVLTNSLAGSTSSEHKSNTNLPNHQNILKSSEKRDTTVPINSSEELPVVTRPGSARPAAPRLQGKLNITFNDKEPVKENSTILNDYNNSMVEDDTNNVIVVSGPQLQPINGLEMHQINQEEHGHLVTQILETQKDLVHSSEFNRTSIALHSENESKVNVSYETAVKEINKLRHSIQQLTSASNPLGKLTDLIQENIEIMQKEHSLWINQNRNSRKYLATKKLASEKSIEDIKQLLKENTIITQSEVNRIQQLKIEIAKNNDKIRKMINK